MSAGAVVLTIFGILNAWALLRGWQYLLGWLPQPQGLTLVNGKLTPLHKIIDGVKYQASWTCDGVVSWIPLVDQPLPPDKKGIKLVEGDRERRI